MKYAAKIIITPQQSKSTHRTPMLALTDVNFNKFQQLLFCIHRKTNYLCSTFRTKSKICGNSSVGRVEASQASGREFEPRLPLQIGATTVVALSFLPCLPAIRPKFWQNSHTTGQFFCAYKPKCLTLHGFYDSVRPTLLQTLISIVLCKKQKKQFLHWKTARLSKAIPSGATNHVQAKWFSARQ